MNIKKIVLLLMLSQNYIVCSFLGKVLNFSVKNPGTKKIIIKPSLYSKLNYNNIINNSLLKGSGKGSGFNLWKSLPMSKYIGMAQVPKQNFASTPEDIKKILEFRNIVQPNKITSVRKKISDKKSFYDFIEHIKKDNNNQNLNDFFKFVEDIEPFDPDSRMDKTHKVGVDIHYWDHVDRINLLTEKYENEEDFEEAIRKNKEIMETIKKKYLDKFEIDEKVINSIFTGDIDNSVLRNRSVINIIKGNLAKKREFDNEKKDETKRRIKVLKEFGLDPRNPRMQSYSIHAYRSAEEIIKKIGYDKAKEFYTAYDDTVLW